MARLTVHAIPSALAFPGGSGPGPGYVDCGVASQLGLTSNFSVGFWARANATQLNTVEGEFCSKGVPGVSGWKVSLGSQGYNIEFTACGVVDLPIPSYVLPKQQWQHIVFVFDATYKATAYVNGVSVGSAQGSSPCTVSPSNFRIGSDGSSPGNYRFSGALAEVRVWNRALSASEVSSLYFSNVVPRTGLVGEWLLNDGSGTSVADTSGNSNTGTLQGSPLPLWTTDTPMKARVAATTRMTPHAIPSGLQYDGSQNWVRRGGGFVTSGLNYTYAFWLFIRKLQSNSVAISEYDTAAWTTKNAMFLYAGDPGFNSYLRITIKDSTGTNSGVNPLVALSAVSSPVGAWHHVVYSRATASVGATPLDTVWIDGLQARQYAAGTWAGTAPLEAGFAGTDPNAIAQFGSLRLAEIRAWNRALSASEVSSLYFSNVVPRTGLVGEWLLNDGSGTTVADTSGNGNTGTLQGSPPPQWTTDTPMKARLTAGARTGA